MRRGEKGGRSNTNMRGGSARAFAQLLGEGMNRLQIERKIKEHTASLVWAEVVGPQVAGATQVMGVSDGVLRVSTKSSVWATELTFYTSDILRRLNTRLNGSPLGPPIIRDIHFQNRGITHQEEEQESRTTLPRPTVEEMEDIALSPEELAIIEQGIASVTDEGLRERMRRVRITDARLKIWRMDNGWLPCPECGTMSPPRRTADGVTLFGEPDCPRCRIALRAAGSGLF